MRIVFTTDRAFDQSGSRARVVISAIALLIHLRSSPE